MPLKDKVAATTGGFLYELGFATARHDAEPHCRINVPHLTRARSAVRVPLLRGVPSRLLCPIPDRLTMSVGLG
jgi:hypothetical protein